MTTMVTGDDDNDVDGNCVTGNESNDDGDGAMGNEVNNDGDGVTGNDNDNDNDGEVRRRWRQRRRDGQRRERI